jgi:hypothetical protein
VGLEFFGEEKANPKEVPGTRSFGALQRRSEVVAAEEGI